MRTHYDISRTEPTRQIDDLGTEAFRMQCGFARSSFVQRLGSRVPSRSANRPRFRPAEVAPRLGPTTIRNCPQSTSAADPP